MSTPDIVEVFLTEATSIVEVISTGPIGTPGAAGSQGTIGNTGAQGNAGTNGTNGTNGQGVPVGGTVDQVLAKINSTDFNTQWVTSNVTHTGDVTGSTSLTIADGVVTLAKQADMASGSLVYRRTAGSGVPEVQTIATLRTDLNLAPDQTPLFNNIQLTDALQLFDSTRNDYTRLYTDAGQLLVDVALGTSLSLLTSASLANTALTGTPTAPTAAAATNTTQLATTAFVKAVLAADVTKFHVKTYGAVGDNVAMDTVAINNAIQAAYDNGGGTVVFEPGKTYAVTQRAGQGILPSLLLKNKVSLQGNGCTLVLRDNCTVIGNDGNFTYRATITANVAVGATTLTVDSTAQLLAGESIGIKLGDNQWDSAETKQWMLARIVTVNSSTSLTIDTPTPIAMVVASTTAANRSIVRYRANEIDLVENIIVDNFKIVQGVGGNTEHSIWINQARNCKLMNIVCENPGAGVCLSYCENVNIDGLAVPLSIRQSAQSSKGRILTIWNSTNCDISNVIAERIEGAPVFIESYCRAISLTNWKFTDNWTAAFGTSRHDTLFFVGQGSQAHVSNITVLGSGSGLLFTDSGGTTADFTFSNVAIRTTSKIKVIYLENWVGGYVELDGVSYKFIDVKKVSQVVDYLSNMAGYAPSLAPPGGLILQIAYSINDLTGAGLFSYITGGVTYQLNRPASNNLRVKMTGAYGTDYPATIVAASRSYAFYSDTVNPGTKFTAEYTYISDANDKITEISRSESVFVNSITGLGSGVATALKLASSGTGALVSVTSPTLTTPILGVASGTSLALSGNLSVGAAGSTGSNSTKLEGAGVLSEIRITNDANVNEKQWHWQSGSALGSGLLRLRMVNDAVTDGANAIVLTRTGIASCDVSFPSGAVIVGASGVLVGGTNLLEQRNSTNAQRLNIYGTYTDASNYRRMFLSSTTGGAFTLGVEGLGTGVSNNTLTIASATNTSLNISRTLPASPANNVNHINLQLNSLLDANFTSAANTGLTGFFNYYQSNIDGANTNGFNYAHWNQWKTNSGTGSISTARVFYNQFEKGGGSVVFGDIDLCRNRVDIYDGSGNITTIRGLSVFGLNSFGGFSGVVATAYGIFLAPVTAATNNWAIYSEGGASWFEGALTCNSPMIERASGSSVTLTIDRQLAIEATSNTAGNIVYRGSDGTTRRSAITFV